MKNEQFKFAPITRSIIGCAMAVHNQLGNGFQELIYHRALAIEMTKQGLKFQDDVEVVIFYDCISIGKRRVDFLVESLIPVEIKAVKELDNVHLAQAINYLEAYKMEVGLLINFGSIRLQFHRILKPRLG
ncbi:MAG: GxxExxY protein [Bacteroidota bacterium]